MGSLRSVHGVRDQARPLGPDAQPDRSRTGQRPKILYLARECHKRIWNVAGESSVPSLLRAQKVVEFRIVRYAALNNVETDRRQYVSISGSSRLLARPVVIASRLVSSIASSQARPSW